MRPLHLLLTPCLLSAMALPGFAADNLSNVVQQGNDNSGSVSQVGQSNRLGTTVIAANQNGDRNVLAVTQTGDDNRIGSVGFLQASDRNSATLVQAGNNNVVQDLLQTGFAAGTTALRSNILSVSQQSIGSLGNRIGVVSQLRLASSAAAPANSATLTQAGGGNVMSEITQRGFDNSLSVNQGGLNNLLTGAIQDGSANSASVAVAGDDNLLGLSQTGSDNQLTINIFGSWTNRGNFTGVAASLAGTELLSPGQLSQTGTGNVISLEVGSSLEADNSGNLFAFTQTGSGNSITGIMIGDDNEAVVIQNGFDNVASFSQIGSGNIIAVIQ